LLEFDNMAHSSMRLIGEDGSQDKVTLIHRT
jgi:hypothetical protein